MLYVVKSGHVYALQYILRVLLFNFLDNKLQGLPNSIKDLKSLRTLDISGTNKVIYLPKTICHVRTLEVVVLSNSSQMEYPPAREYTSYTYSLG